MSEADFLLSASQTMPYEKWRLHVQKKTVQIAKTGSAHQQASLEPLDRNRSDDHRSHHKSRAHKTEHFGETQTDESKKNVESPRSALRLALAARQEIDSDSDSGDSLSYAPLPSKKPIRARTDSNDSSSVSVSWNKNLASVAKPKTSSVASKKGVAKRLVKPATRHHRSASQEEAVLYRSSIGTGAGVNSLGSVPARTVSSARARRAKAPILPGKSMSGSALKEVAFGRSIAKAPGASQTRRNKRAVSTASTPLYNSDSDSSNGSSHGSSHNDSAVLIAARLRRGGSHDRDSEQPTRGRVAVRRDSVTFLKQKRDGVPPLVDLDDDGNSPPAPPPPRARRSSLDQRIVGGQVVQTTPLKPRKTSKRRDDRTHMRPTQSSRSRAKSVKAKRKHHRPWRPSSAHPNRHSMPFGWGQTAGPARSHSAAPSRHRSAVASGSRRGERSEDAESKPRMAALANKLTLEFARMFIRANGYLPHYKLYKRWLNQNEVASYSRLGEAAYNGLTLPLQVLQRRELFVQQQSKRGLLTNSTPSEPGPRTGTLAAGRAGLVNGSQDLVVESAPIETIYKEPRTPSVSFRASAEVMQRPRRPNARSRTVKLTTNSLLDAKAAEAIISSAMKQTPVQLGRVGTFMRSPAPRRFEDESVVRSPGNSRRTSYDEEALDLDGEGDEAAAT